MEVRYTKLVHPRSGLSALDHGLQILVGASIVCDFVPKVLFESRFASEADLDAKP